MDPDGLTLVLLLASLAGGTIPLGGLAARTEMMGSWMLGDEARHSVVAFGGGVLFAAVALVLVPEGTAHVSPPVALLSFGSGGLVFFAVDRAIGRSGRSAGQFLAMVMDFLPESLALGAMLASDRAAGVLLAVLIGLQNLPEGFNAYRELCRTGTMRSSIALGGFVAIALLGPLTAWVGFAYLQSAHGLLGGIMLFAGGGILYLTFQDVAPQSHIARTWAPALGAVAGFLLGLAGQILIQ